MKHETEDWPYVPAKWVGPKRIGPVRLVVIHTAEMGEHSESAENLAKYGQNPDYESSWHIAVDNTSVVQCVKDSYVAKAAPGANHDGIQVELACRASQSVAQWRDMYSLAQLAIAADAVAQYCLKYSIPSVRLTDAQLDRDFAGIVGHDQVTRVYRKSTHLDPGPNFPWKRFIAMVSLSVIERSGL